MSSGFLLINKELGITSFDVIRKLRRQLQIKKMGHAGTLDPMASGLLVIAVGEATKLLNHIDTSTKDYEFKIQFGTTMDTGDSDGRVLESGFRIPNEAEILSVIPKFIGDIEQTPPIYSAVKIKGKRAYQLAREGKEVIIKPRTITIAELKLISYDSDKGIAKMFVSCSTGTYVRSLSEDIAKSLNSGAYALSIHRTRIGAFNLSDSSLVEDVTDVESIIYPTKLLTHWSKVLVTGRGVELVRNGCSLTRDYKESQEGDCCFMVDENDKILSLSKYIDGSVKPVKVFVD